MGVLLAFDALQQRGRRFIVWILRHQFAAEGFGQERWRQLVDLGAGSLIARGQAVGVGKEDFNAADDFVLPTAASFLALFQRLLVSERSKDRTQEKS